MKANKHVLVMSKEKKKHVLVTLESLIIGRRKKNIMMLESGFIPADREPVLAGLNTFIINPTIPYSVPKISTHPTKKLNLHICPSKESQITQ